MNNIGIIRGPGVVLGRTKIGSDTIKISKNNRYFYSLLNDRAIIESKSEKDLSTRGIPVLAHIVRVLCKKAGIDQLRWLPTTNTKKNNLMLSEAIKALSENIKPISIMVLEMVPDEVADQMPKEAHIKNLMNYQQSLKDCETTVNALRETSDALLRTNLVKKMWGSRDIMDIIHNIRETLNKFAEYYETADICFEGSDNRINIIITAFKRNIPLTQIKDIVGKTLEDFSFLKSFVSAMAVNLQPLYGIDKDFKAKIGYPATWFFNPTIFMNFTDSYDNLINHLIKFASLELEVIEPLLIRKMTGAI